MATPLDRSQAEAVARVLALAEFPTWQDLQREFPEHDWASLVKEAKEEAEVDIIASE